jgi:hypothetical protein
MYIVYMMVTLQGRKILATKTTRKYAHNNLPAEMTNGLLNVSLFIYMQT